MAEISLKIGVALPRVSGGAVVPGVSIIATLAKCEDMARRKLKCGMVLTLQRRRRAKRSDVLGTSIFLKGWPF